MLRIVNAITILGLLAVSGCAVTSPVNTQQAAPAELPNAQRKALVDVDIDALVEDTQAVLKGGDTRHLAIAWWIPVEFWEAANLKNNAMSQSDRTALKNTLTGTTLLGIVQADISTYGAFDYYSKDEVEKNLEISYVSADGSTVALSPLKDIDANIRLVLSLTKPILESAMGNLGSNFHFFVLHDRSDAGGRLIDPYRFGRVEVHARKKVAGELKAVIELPLNALYVPRQCPNGKEAHVSWNYCPWSGQRL